MSKRRKQDGPNANRPKKIRSANKDNGNNDNGDCGDHDYDQNAVPLAYLVSTKLNPCKRSSATIKNTTTQTSISKLNLRKAIGGEANTRMPKNSSDFQQQAKKTSVSLSNNIKRKRSASFASNTANPNDSNKAKNTSQSHSSLRNNYRTKDILASLSSSESSSASIAFSSKLTDSMDTALQFLQPQTKYPKQKRTRAKIHCGATATKTTRIGLLDIQKHFDQRKRRQQNVFLKRSTATVVDAGAGATTATILSTTTAHTRQATNTTSPQEKAADSGLAIRMGSSDLTEVSKNNDTTRALSTPLEVFDTVEYDDGDAFQEPTRKEVPTQHRATATPRHKSRNLIHQLMDRSVLGCRGRNPRHGPRMALSTSLRQLSPSQRPLVAKPASWINLGTTSQGTTNVTIKVDCMAFDPMGVLLAVAQRCSITKQSWIDIYDWDTVCAADRRGRSAKARAQANNRRRSSVSTSSTTCHGVRLDVPPLLQFRVPSSSENGFQKTQWLRWNPYHADQLAVASRGGDVVYSVNVSHVEKALTALTNSRIHKPPRHSYWEFKAPLQCSAVSSFVFVAKDHLVVAYGPTLQCWRYFPKRDPTSIEAKLKWQYHFPFSNIRSLDNGCISSLETIGREHLVAGTNRGHLSLVHWKRTVTAKSTSSFSNTAVVRSPAPTVLCRWLPHGSLATSGSVENQIPPEHVQDPSIMGIQQLRVVQDYVPGITSDTSTNKTPKQTSRFEQLCGRFSIQWIIRCGWAMEVPLVASPSTSGTWTEYKVSRGKTHVMHRTSRVQTKLASGEFVTTKQGNVWSLPTNSVATDASGSFLCWQNVPSVTRVLPHHDHRVLDDQPSLTRDRSQSFLFNLHFKSIYGRAVEALGAKVMQNQASETPPTTTPQSLPLLSLTLPKQQGHPKMILIDPAHQEWAIVATFTEKLYILSLRAQS